MPSIQRRWWTWGSALAAALGCGVDGPAVPALPPVVIAALTLPPAIIGVPYQQGLSATGGNGTYTWSLAAGALPEGITLAASGLLTGTATTVEAREFTVRVASGGRDATLRTSLATDHPPLAVATTVLPNGTVGLSYSQLLNASGGVPGGVTTWSLASGVLPGGLALLTAGILVGTPTVAGTADLRVRVVRAGQAAEQALQLVVAPAPLTIVTIDLPEARVGVTYVGQVEARGGTGSYTWSLANGRLPTGLTLGAGGAVAGTPTTVDTALFTVDVVSGTQRVSRLIGLVVEPATYPPTAIVDMPGDIFAPFLVRIRPGGVVTWRFGSRAHNAVFASAVGAPPDINIVSDTSVTRAFALPGAFRYDCTIHPGMSGRVEVR